MTFSPADIAAIQTPAVLIDLDIATANIGRFQHYADTHGLRVRPHIKTHKLPAIAHLQIAAGAVGITCQKVSEAEAMVAADSAITDVLITYNIVGAEKLERLKALAKKVKLSVVADNAAVVNGLSEAFRNEFQPLTVLVECDTGANRCGVLTPGPYPHAAWRRFRWSYDLSSCRRGGCRRGFHDGGQDSHRSARHRGARHHVRRDAFDDARSRRAGYD